MARYDDCKYSRIWHLKIQNNIFELTAKRRCNIIISQTLKIESERGINISSEKCDEGTSRFGFNYETRQLSFRNVCFFIVMMISRAGLLENWFCVGGCNSRHMAASSLCEVLLVLFQYHVTYRPKNLLSAH